MVDIKSAISEGCSLLQASNIENYKNECLMILEHILNKNQAFLYTHLEYILSDQEYKIFISIINERCLKKPLQYILGYQEFMGLNFNVTPDVLIPRQDTEILVENILNKITPSDSLFILDIGTGSGCISISLAKFLKNSIVISLDISENALNIAYSNAKLNNVLDRVFFFKSDVFSAIKAIDNNTLDFFGRQIPNLAKIISNKFNIIVSNPPYIPLDEMKTLDTGVIDFEPNLALYGGIDGLDFYKKITKESVHFLRRGGFLAFEVGYNQANSVKFLMEKSFTNIDIIRDYNNIERVVIGDFFV